MRYVFLDCEFDTHLHTLWRAGEPYRLRPKVFQLLCYLITQRQRVVPKSELIAQCWPDPNVSDAAVEGTIRDLRRAVGDDRHSQHIIQTLPGHGYRFVAPLAVVGEAEEPAGAPEAAAPVRPSGPPPGSEVEAADAPGNGWTCAVCHHVVPPGQSPHVRFCPACGVELGLLCVPCGVRSPPQSRFCGACGRPLAEPPPSEPLVPGMIGSRAEQRQLTVVACELVDAIRVSQHLGLEAYRVVVRDYHEVYAALMEHYEGYRVPSHSDGGLLGYFGWPQAHDDDVQRAVHVGLGLVEAVREMQARLAREHATSVAVRVGIHTGVVLIEDRPAGGTREPLVLGEPIYMATWLRGLAAPNSVVMSAETARLVQEYFVVQALPSQVIEGRDEPLGVVRVLRPSGA